MKLDIKRKAEMAFPVLQAPRYTPYQSELNKINKSKLNNGTGQKF